MEFKEGSLYYSREDAGGDDPVKLTAMSGDTFIIEGVIFIRLRFEIDPEGQPAALTVMFEDGNRVRSTRDK